MAEDLLSGLYVDNRFKTGDGVEKPPQVDSVKFFGAEEGAGSTAAALKQARAFAEVGWAGLGWTWTDWPCMRLID